MAVKSEYLYERATRWPASRWIVCSVDEEQISFPRHVASRLDLKNPAVLEYQLEKRERLS